MNEKGKKNEIKKKNRESRDSMSLTRVHTQGREKSTRTQKQTTAS